MKRNKIIQQRVIEFDAVESTNEKAKEMLDENIDEGSVIVAKRQVAGRGRFGRKWHSPPGGLYLSIVLKPLKKNVHLISLLSGLPVVATLREWGVEATLKWPNDLMIEGKKVGGILCEGVHHRNEFYVIVGIGINTSTDLRRFPDDVRLEATSLKREVKKDIDKNDFLSKLLDDYDSFYRRYVACEFVSLIQEYKDRCTTLGKHLTVETARGRVVGMAKDISSQGALLIEETDGKGVEVFEGSVLIAND